MDEDHSLPVPVCEVPVRALSLPTTSRFCEYLDVLKIISLDNGFPKDYRGLAELMGYSTQFISQLEGSTDKTRVILRRCPSEVTLGKLWCFLHYLEREDCVTDLKECVVEDAEKWIKTTNTQPLRFSADDGKSGLEAEPASEALTLYDVYGQDPQLYLACLCCADADLDRAKQITDMFPDCSRRFFISQYHLLAGLYEYETTAQVIQERCNGRVMVLITKNYSSCPGSIFATQFAKSLDPDARKRCIVPIIYDEDAEIPRILHGIACLRKYRMPEELFNQQLKICLFGRMNNSTNADSKQNAISLKSDSEAISTAQSLRSIRASAALKSTSGELDVTFCDSGDSVDPANQNIRWVNSDATVGPYPLANSECRLRDKDDICGTPSDTSVPTTNSEERVSNQNDTKSACLCTNSDQQRRLSTENNFSKQTVFARLKQKISFSLNFITRNDDRNKNSNNAGNDVNSFYCTCRTVQRNNIGSDSIRTCMSEPAIHCIASEDADNITENSDIHIRSLVPEVDATEETISYSQTGMHETVIYERRKSSVFVLDL